jgi:hypothetical protein
MKTVKIAFNRQTWHPTEGTYYRGCFTLPRKLYEKFSNQSNTTNTEHYLKISDTLHLIKYLKFKGIPFNEKRAYGAFNYYINIVEEGA